MSIANEITNYANGLSDAYDAVNDMQGVIPTDKNMNNLDTAIRTIPQSTGPTYTAGTGIDITNDVISATNTGLAKLLTTADRNWNTTTDSPDSQNPNAIAAWLLPPGIYYVDSYTGYAYVSKSTSPMIIMTPMLSSKIYIVTNADSTQGKSIIELGNLANNNYEFGMIRKYGNDTTGVPIKYMYVGKPIDSLTSSDASFPLSAKQGKILKDLIDSLVVKNAGAPTTSTAGTVGKLYEDTTNGKLYICTDATNPYVWTEVGASGATYTAGNGISIDANNEISIDDTVVAEVSDLPGVMTGATSQQAGTAGLVPAPAAGDEGKVLHGDGTWKDTTAKLVEMSYGEANSWAKFIAAYNAGSIVYCRASSNANPATGSQTRKAFMAYVNNATSPTSVEFQYVRSQSSKTAAQQFDQVFVYKLTNSNGGTWTVESRDMGPKIVAGTGMSSTFTTGANATITLNAEPDYSTSEVDTKVKWIDGKTIYRKTVNVGAMPNATTTSTNIGASNVSHYIKIEGVAWTSDGNTTIALPFTQTASTSYQISVYISNGDIMITAGDDKSAYTQGYVTVYYTKSS